MPHTLRRIHGDGDDLSGLVVIRWPMTVIEIRRFTANETESAFSAAAALYRVSDHP